MAVSDNVVHSGTAADTTLASDITSGSTSLTLTSGTGFPSPTGGQIAYLVLAPGTAAEEVVSYTARSGANVTGVTRGLHGTSASSHVAGKTVRHQWTAGESDDVIKATLNTLGRVTAIGDTLYADSTTTLARLAKGTSGQFLKQGASIPAWASLASADISDLAEFIRDTIGTALTAGANVTITPNDGSDIITISASAPTAIFIPAGRFSSAVGSPSLSVAGGWPVWLLDATSDEAVVTTVGIGEIPSNWLTFHVDYWWTDTTVGAGNVVLTVAEGVYGDGGTLNIDTSQSATVAAVAQNEIEVSTVYSSVAVPAAAEAVALRAGRSGSNGADTLAGDIGFLGFRLRQAT